MTKILVVILFFGMLLAGRRLTWWPLISWPMYHARIVPYPDRTHTVIEIRAIDDEGRSHSFLSSDLMHYDRSVIVERVVEDLLNPAEPAHFEQYSVYLADLVRRKLPTTQIVEVQFWEVTWQVDAMSVPPFDREQPIREELRSQFSVMDIAAE